MLGCTSFWHKTKFDTKLSKCRFRDLFRPSYNGFKCVRTTEWFTSSQVKGVDLTFICYLRNLSKLFCKQVWKIEIGVSEMIKGDSW